VKNRARWIKNYTIQIQSVTADQSRYFRAACTAVRAAKILLSHSGAHDSFLALISVLPRAAKEQFE